MTKRARTRRSEHPPVRPGAVVGVPVLPPGRMAARAQRFRGALAGVHRATAPPPLRILEAAFGVVEHGALVAFCDLGVPDALDGPMTTADLAARLGVPEPGLATVVRYAATRGWVRIDRRGRVRPTRVTRFLAAAHPGGWRAWVDFTGSAEVTSAFAALAGAVRSGGDAFALAHGSSFFDHLRTAPELSLRFDAAMAAGARLHGLALAAALDWSDARRVCDVGGGNGTLLTTLLGARPDLHGVLLDLPHVVAGATASSRLDVVGGDAFAAVPPGCDVYLLVNIIHDWDDERAGALLGRIAADAPAAAKVVVVESERPERPVDGMAVRTDVLMLALAPGGRERTRAEIEELARGRGYDLQRVVPLASADVAYILTRRR